MKVKVGAKEVDFDLSRAHIEKILKKSGIEINKIVNNEKMFDKACKTVCRYPRACPWVSALRVNKCIPIPVRWAVGEKRVTAAMGKIREQLIAVTNQAGQKDSCID